MPFIPVDKMKALRAAAAQGDERARKILHAQLDGADFGADLESFFAPKQESEQGQFSMPATEQGQMPANVSTGNAKLDEWLRSNGINSSDEDYEDALEEYFAEFPNERPAGGMSITKKTVSVSEPEPAVEAGAGINLEDEMLLIAEMGKKMIEAITVCDETLISVSQNEEIDDAGRKGAMTILQEIKQSLFDNADKLKKIKESLNKKSQKQEGDLL